MSLCNRQEWRILIGVGSRIVYACESILFLWEAGVAQCGAQGEPEIGWRLVFCLWTINGWFQISFWFDTQKFPMIRCTWRFNNFYSWLTLGVCLFLSTKVNDRKEVNYSSLLQVGFIFKEYGDEWIFARPWRKNWWLTPKICATASFQYLSLWNSICTLRPFIICRTLNEFCICWTTGMPMNIWWEKHRLFR